MGETEVVISRSKFYFLLCDRESLICFVVVAELNLYVGQLTPRQKADSAVQHALEVQRALATGNYYKLCALYLTAPYMGPYIMDHFIDRERVRGLMVMAKAFV